MSADRYPVAYGLEPTEAHAQACAREGHATWTEGSTDRGICPRCGVVTAPANREQAPDLEALERAYDRSIFELEAAWTDHDVTGRAFRRAEQILAERQSAHRDALAALDAAHLAAREVLNPAEVLARATGAVRVVHTVERRNLDGSLEVLEVHESGQA